MRCAGSAAAAATAHSFVAKARTQGNQGKEPQQLTAQVVPGPGSDVIAGRRTSDGATGQDSAGSCAMLSLMMCVLTSLSYSYVWVENVRIQSMLCRHDMMSQSYCY